MGEASAEPHWVAWHRYYDDPNSALPRRLAFVQRRLRDALDAAPSGEIRLLSMCAGQGRDVLGVLPDHPRRDDVRARLVELEPTLAADAERAARAAGLDGVEVVRADAGTTDAYASLAPVAVALVCGVFGNITDDDIRRTAEELPGLCAPGATVIWTRHRREPDRTPAVRSYFTEGGFTEVAFDVEDGHTMSVGTYRLTGEARPYQPGVRMFTFVGDGGQSGLRG